MRGGSVNYGGMDDGYVPDYHTGRRISATQYQQQQYEQVLVFCYQNWSDLLWEKIVLVIEKYLKFEAEGQEFAKYLRSLEQFIQTVKGQNNFGNKIPVPVHIVAVDIV